MKLAVITDNTAYLSETVKQRDDLIILDIPIVFDETSYVEGKTISQDEFFAKMRTSKELPKTSQPSLSELVDHLNLLEEAGYTHVIGLFLSSGISGFWQNIQYLPEEYPGMTIAFPDSKITSRPLGLFVESVFKAYENGSDFETILSELTTKIDNTHAYIMVNDLNHLVKGGRLSNGSALLGNLLNIKPILYFDDEGKIVVYEKVRTEKKAYKRLLDVLGTIENLDDYHLILIHSFAKEKVLFFEELLEKNGFTQDVEVVSFSAVIATHLGEGALAFAISPK